MANPLKTLHLCGVLFWLIAIQTGPVALERQMVDKVERDDVINPAASNEELLRQVSASHASAPAIAVKEIKKRGNEPLKNFILLSLVRHKEQQGHKRNQSLTKHHHQHQHNSPSAAIRLPRPSPTFSFSKKTEEPVDFSTEENAQITPTRSVDSWLTQLIFTPVLRYARAVDKVTDDSQVKIANISSSTPISSMATISMQPNKSVTVHPTDPTDEQDPCTVWQNCALNQHLKASRWFQKLPSCSCQLQPTQFIYNNTIYDPALNKSFQWKGMKVDKRGLLRRTAQFCIRSLPHTSLSAQVCCYDSKLQLITRGIGAGTPFVVSPDRNASMHYELDVLPIRLCNGDWTRYHAVRPPNNGRNCSSNPDYNEFALQVLKARDY